MAIRSARSFSLAILVVYACAGITFGTAATGAQNSSEPAQKAASPNGCPVTKPADAFVPPAPYESDSPLGSFFFGTPKLWTLVWMNSWQGRKLVWWSPGNDRKTALPPGLTLTLTRLDAPASPLTADHSSWAHIEGQPAFITTGVRTSPTGGCWEIAGQLKGNEVKYVVWVGPRPAN